MVKIGQDPVPEVSYAPRAAGASGLEVVSLATLDRRLHSSDPPIRIQRPDFHVVVHVEHGVLRHLVDFAAVDAAPGSWLWVRPGQVQRYGELGDVAGTVLLFPSGSLPAGAAARAGLEASPSSPLVEPTGEEAGALLHALEHLQLEFAARVLPSAVRGAVLSHLLAALVLRLASVTGDVEPTPHGPRPEAFERLRAAVDEDFARHRDVTHYARRLGYAPRTLTRATLQAAGVGAKEYIDRRVVLEAKRLLVHGTDPVGTVGAAVGFSDASNFGAFFALRVGCTPAEFRSRFREGGV